MLNEVHKNIEGEIDFISTNAIDITEIKEQEKELNKLSTIIKQSNAYVWIAGLDAKFIYMNNMVREALEIKEEEDITQINVFDLHADTSIEKMETIRKELLEKGVWTGEAKMKSKSGKIIYTLQIIMTHLDKDGKPEFYSSTAIDISEQKKLQQETTKLARIIQKSNALIGIANPDFTVSYMNEAMRNKYGFGLEEDISSLNINALIPAETLKIYNEVAFPALMKDGKFKGEVEWMHRDGTLFTVAMLNEVHKNEEGEIDFISTNAIDITEIKEKEKELKQLNNIIQQSNAFIGIAGLDKKFIYLNDSLREAFEIQPDEDITQYSTSEFHTKATNEYLNKINIRKELIEKGVWTGETEMISKSGKIISTLQVIMMQFNDKGEPYCISTTAIDITETKNKNKELEKLSNIIEHSASFAGIANIEDDTLLYLNSSMKKAFEIAETEEIIKYKIFDFLSTESVKQEIIFDELNKHGQWNGQNEFKSKSGKIIPVMQSIILHKNEVGQPEYISTTAIDITEIKNKNKELEKLSIIIEKSNSFAGIAKIDDSSFLYLNSSMKKALDIDEEDYTKYKIFNFLTPESAEFTKNTAFAAVMEHGVWQGQTEWISKTGRIIPVIQTIMLHVNENGDPEYISTTAIDITEIKNKTTELQKLTDIIENATSYAGIMNMKDATIQYCNPSMREALEIEEEEDYSKYKIVDFLTVDAVKHTEEIIFTEVMQHGQWKGLNEFKSKSGKVIPVMQSIILHKNEKGEPEYASTTAIDVSELKQREDELENLTLDLRSLYNNLQNVKEEERKVIAKEIHDELGQNLTALKLNVAWISKHLDGDKSLIQERLKSLENITSETVNTSRRLYNNLYPQMLDEVGVAGAILWLTNSYKTTTGIDIEFTTNINLDNEKLISQPVGLALFRIYQECFTNILRYAKPNLVVIELYIKDKQIFMSIEDDGIGFVINEVDTKVHHGLLGMRERAIALNGNLSIISSVGKGTKTSVDIPLVIDN